jgi:hypothetical protein
MKATTPRQYRTLRWLAPALLSAMFAACAIAPAPTAAPAVAATAVDCETIATEQAHALEERRAALEKQDGAWRAVVPFAVAARYASGKSALGDAERRLQELNAQADRLGCPRAAG